MGFTGIILAAVALSAQPTARQVVEATIDGRISEVGGFDESVLSRFLNYPPNAAVANSAFLSEHFVSPFKPNPKFWLKGVDFTCASPWNSAGGRQRAGTAISRRHIAFAKHFQIGKGTRIVFVGADGSPSAYYVEKTKALKKGDIMIGSLNAELTPDIHPARIMPSDWTNHLGRAEGLPVVAMTQEEKASVSELMPLLTNSVYDLVSFRKPKVESRKPYRLPIRPGDSGGPVFVILGDEAVLLFTLTTHMGGYGFHNFRAEIQSVMDELCPGYTLEVFDFATSGAMGSHQKSGLSDN